MGHKESMPAGPEVRAQQQVYPSWVVEVPARPQQPAPGRSHFSASQELLVRPAVLVWRWRVSQGLQVLVAAGWVRDWSSEEPAEL